jgi:P-type Cu+ transporter
MLKKEPCYHCGEVCDEPVIFEEKRFCCNGCKLVYALLNENGLCSYYDLDSSPGLKIKGKFRSERFAYLDDETIIKKMARFRSDKQFNVTFSLPQVHCSSCVYLLENLHRIQPGVISSTVNFQRKEIFIVFDPAQTTLRKVVELLAFIGYEPSLSLKDAVTGEELGEGLKKDRQFKRIQLTKIGVAGFCFANIMMLSFPEYLSSGKVEEDLKQTFSWFSLILSLPALLFAASGFFISAWKGLRQRYINIDAPIALATTITFLLSYYQIISGTGAGYLDSGSGIIFFMLVGRWFQNKTYETLSFDRDYLSYLPLSVTTVKDSLEDGFIIRKEKTVPVNLLKKGDHIVIHNGEIIPADAKLLDGQANIDYSFVNGENIPVQKKNDELIYAGGKQVGANILLVVEQPASHSYITELWNNNIFSKQKGNEESYIHPWSRYFTLFLFTIAICASIFWAIQDPSNIITALVSVLIVACPCSLLLSATFTYGNMLRVFGRNKFYLKNAKVIETLANVNCIVFDKTGTLTQPGKSLINYSGNHLSDNEKNLLAGLSTHSSHPFGRLLSSKLGNTAPVNINIKDFKEYAGLGIDALVNGQRIRIGTNNFIPAQQHGQLQSGTRINVEIAKKYIGCFYISNHYREGIKQAVSKLSEAGYELHVLSGDNDSEKENLQNIFGNAATIKFNQLPAGKLQYIQSLQIQNKKVLMIGDGLNDAGALMQADAGVAINNNDSQFSPACDAILSAEHISRLDKFLRYARDGKKIITASFILSIAYNIVGFSFAVSASLSPMVAAILMPASSISIISFVTIAGNLVAARKKM